jgi:tyrosyl-DNA phosphodiesterase 2
VNVHLDSLPIHPSFRPEQLSIVAKYLETAGRGIVAGDFNPVLPEDEGILPDNGLIDSWTYLYPQEAGFTWGYLNDKPFPPSRLDKVAMLNVKPESMRILQMASIMYEDKVLDFSDHLGLSCTFKCN